MRKRNKIGFTLIEMLGVLTIMAILMAVTISSFRGLGKSSRMDAALNQLTATLRLSRQLAITKTAPVSVVFPSYSQNTNYGLRAYAAFQNGQQVCEWKYLPEGIFFNDSGALTANCFNASYNVKNTNFPGLPQGDYACIRFRPDGTINASYPRIWLAETIQKEDGTLVDLNKTTFHTNSIRLNNLTGTSKIYY